MIKVIKHIYKRIESSVALTMMFGTLVSIIPCALMMHWLTVKPLPWSLSFKIPAEMCLMAMPIFGLCGWMMDMANRSRNRESENIRYLLFLEKQMREYKHQHEGDE